MTQDLSKIKIMGGIGTILSLLGGGVISLAGWILILIAFWELTKMTQEKSIFKNYLIGSILGSIGMVGFIIGIILCFSGLAQYSTKPSSSFEKPIPLSFSLSILIVCWALMVFGKYLVMKSFKKVTEITQEEKFATAGTLYFIGGLATLVLVGFLIGFVGQIFAILAFFSLPDKAEIRTAQA